MAATKASSSRMKLRRPAAQRAQGRPHHALRPQLRAAAVVRGEDHRVVGEGPEPVVKGVEERAAPGLHLPAEVRPAHALHEERVAREQVALAHQIGGGARRVPRRGEDRGLHGDAALRAPTALATQPQQLAVRERAHGQVEGHPLPRGDEEGRARARRQLGAAAQVVRVDVRVQHPDDARPQPADEVLVEGDVARRVHHHRVLARADDVGEAALAAAVELPHFEAALVVAQRQAGGLEVGAIGLHPALDVERLVAGLAEQLRDELGRAALGAQDHHRPARWVLRHLRHRRVRVFDEVEVRHLHGVDRPGAVDGPGRGLVLVADVEQQHPLALVRTAQELFRVKETSITSSSCRGWVCFEAQMNSESRAPDASPR